MTKTERYRVALRGLPEWEPFVRAESGLPGPRGNLELVAAVADVGEAERFRRWAALDPERAPENSAEVLLVVGGVVGLGRLVCEGDTAALPELRRHASDPRWRVREGVAMALQRVGDQDMDLLLREMESWSRGALLEQRAAAAGVCEPRLLRVPAHAGRVLDLLDGITASLAGRPERAGEEFRVLRQALGYCWSVAIVALPEKGKPLFERLCACSDRDIAWIVRENVRKNRLARMDPA